MTSVTVKICIIRFKETYIIFSPKQQFFKLVNSGLKYQFSGFLSSLFLSKASACTPAGALPLDPAGGCAPRPLLVFRLFGGYLVASLLLWEGDSHHPPSPPSLA